METTTSQHSQRKHLSIRPTKSNHTRNRNRRQNLRTIPQSFTSARMAQTKKRKKPLVHNQRRPNGELLMQNIVPNFSSLAVLSPALTLHQPPRRSLALLLREGLSACSCKALVNPSPSLAQRFAGFARAGSDCARSWGGCASSGIKRSLGGVCRRLVIGALASLGRAGARLLRFNSCCGGES